MFAQPFEPPQLVIGPRRGVPVPISSARRPRASSPVQHEPRTVRVGRLRRSSDLANLNVGRLCCCDYLVDSLFGIELREPCMRHDELRRIGPVAGRQVWRSVCASHFRRKDS